MGTDEFQELVWERSHQLFRPMPWRHQPTFYYVLVSEIMLQQTQVARVLVKFDEFMAAFPTIEALAAASLADVLRVWVGLGYNRRAKFLHAAARMVVAGTIPSTVDALMQLPGVGYNTAAAIMNYVYEQPHAFVETNIRTVYFKHFFQGQESVSDKALLAVVERTLDREHPREWFWALMDYGAELKSTGETRLDQSKHYKKQPPLKGSVRQVRGLILRLLAERGQSEQVLYEQLPTDERAGQAVQGLLDDGLIMQRGHHFYLTNS